MPLLAVTLLLLAIVGNSHAQTPCSAVNLNNAAETAALRDIYAATNGFSWTVNLNWPAVTDRTPANNACCWVGVTCVNLFGSGVHVTALNLAHNNLVGTLPNSIGNMPYLTDLFVHDNQISGNIPNSLSTLTGLTLLFLSQNQFSGAVFDWSSMSQLATLYLEQNQLTGTLPDFSPLVSLTAFDISENAGINGPLPTTLPSSVQDFRAENCALTGTLSASIIQSGSLQTLKIDNNQLQGLVPDPASSVEVLNISFNDFGCFVPNIPVGVDADIDNNQFLCLPGVQKVVGCATPQITSLVSVCAGAGSATCMAATLALPNPGDPPAIVTLSLQSTLSLIGCQDVYCFLGQIIQGQVSLTSGNQLTCTIAPSGVGIYSISLRRMDGTVLSTSASPIEISVTAGCGANQCNPPNGQCTMMGCVCNQALWTGQDCDQKACPRNCLASSMQGTCQADGTCMCASGTTSSGVAFMWSGDDCSIKQLTCNSGTNGLECSGRGQCVASLGTCNCQPGLVTVGTRMVAQYYTGDACEIISCPQSGTLVCSGHGTCTPGANPCTCMGGATGFDCSIGTMTCSGCVGVDIGQSRCNTFNGQCICASGFLPPSCGTPECPTNAPGHYDVNLNYIAGTVCSGHGTCNTINATTAQCTCTPPWDLISNCAAQRIPCPNANSNGQPCGGKAQGYCVPSTGQCKCTSNTERAYTGDDCDTVTCPFSWSGCSPCDATEACSTNPATPPSTKGTCQFKSVTLPGAVNATIEPYCQCVAGREGLFCQNFACNNGTDGTECSIGTGSGTCDPGSGICICSTVGSPLDPKTACSTLLCPGSNSNFDCSMQGTCNGKTGQCSCNAGFGGAGCDQAVVNPAYIAVGVIAAICFLISCAGGVFYCLRRRAINQLQKH